MMEVRFGFIVWHLSWPAAVCVCVHGHYAYATNIINHCASVFTTDGEHVSSFCQCGKKEGNFKLPFHIFIDNNSFGYVADLYNDRILCF